MSLPASVGQYTRIPMCVEPRIEPKNSQKRVCQRYGNEGDCLRSLPVRLTAVALN